MSSVRAEERFADRLQWDILGPTCALMAAALGGVFIGYEQVAVTGSALQAGTLRLETITPLLEGIPGALIILGLVLGLYAAGLFGLVAAGLEVVGGAILMTGNPLGIGPVLLGGLLMVYGFYIPWWQYLSL